MTRPEARTVRRRLRTEAVALDAFTSVFLAGYVIFDLDPVRALGWGAVAVLVGIAVLESLRVLAPTQDSPTVDLLDIDHGAPDRPRDEEDHTRPSEEHDERSVFGTVLAGVAIPFVVAFVVIRVAILYLVPTLVMAAAIAMTSSNDWGATAAAWLGSVLISVVNEFIVVRPIARHHHVSLD